MLYSETFIGSKNILEDMNVLYQDENNKYIGEIKLKENRRLNQNLLSLEEVCNYCKDYSMNFDYVVNEIAHVNNVDPNTIAFTVYPSTLYEDELIREFAQILESEGNYIYIKNDSNNNISSAFDMVIRECIKTESEEPLNCLLEVYNDIYGLNENMPNRAGEYFKDAFLHNLKGQAVGAVDQYGFGKFLDSEEKDSQGRITIRKNQKLKNALGISNKNKLGNFLADLGADTVRDAGSRLTVDSAESLIRNASSMGRNKFNAQTVNKIDNSINALERQQQRNPQKRGFFRRIIDKLIALKNRILAVLRGRR